MQDCSNSIANAIIALLPECGNSIAECQKHSYFTYLLRRLKFIAPHKLR